MGKENQQPDGYFIRRNGHLGEISPVEAEDLLNLQKKHEFPTSRREFLNELWKQPLENWFHDAATATLDVLNGVNELQKLSCNPILWGRGVPRGDGARVCIVPGFAAAELHYAPTRFVLGNMGYDAKTYPLRFGLNVEPMENMVGKFHDYIYKYKKSTGGRLHIIGHSKGGLLTAVAYAEEPDLFEECVDQAIFLGSPIPKKVNNYVGWAYWATLFVAGKDDFRYTNEIPKLEVLGHERTNGITFIAPHTDDIIHGDFVGHRHNHFRVKSSHSGLPYHPVVLEIIGHKLAKSTQIPESVPPKFVRAA